MAFVSMDALSTLDALHAWVGLTMSKVRPPCFQVEAVDVTMLVDPYSSERVAMAPMVVGDLEGAAERAVHA